MPTKTVIFTALDKFTDGSMRLLKSSEYIQMAGRAGRRGKDDLGLVIYLPQRDPVSLSELQSCMSGAAAKFGSRMNFHYDFLLKILNSGQSLQGLIRGSYWWALEYEDYLGVKAEAEMLERQIAEVRLTEEQISDCQQKIDLELRISQSQNSKKKAAQRELAAWHEEHRSSVWDPILERFSKRETLCSSLYKCQTSYKEYEKYLCDDSFSFRNMPCTALRHQILEECGYVVDGHLSPQGLLASEANEGQPFMMTELFLQQSRALSHSAQLSQKELLTTMALFIGEKRSDDIQNPNQLNVSKPVIDALWSISDFVTKMVAIEKRCGVPYDEKFWGMSLEWVEPIAEWLEGEVILPELAAKYELFEGNLMKALMKLSGVLEEFQAMASLAGEVKMLELLEGARQLVLRDIVLAESLYLRI